MSWFKRLYWHDFEEPSATFDPQVHDDRGPEFWRGYNTCLAETRNREDEIRRQAIARTRRKAGKNDLHWPRVAAVFVGIACVIVMTAVIYLARR